MAYSADFRNKVVQLYNSGTSTADLCAQFHISRSILYQWSEEAKVSNISKRDLATLQRHVATLENENSIYQKSLAALDLSIDNKVQIIDALKSEYSFYTLCRLLNLSKSTYINRQKSALIEKQLDVEDTLLKEKITIIKRHFCTSIYLHLAWLVFLLSPVPLLRTNAYYMVIIA